MTNFSNDRKKFIDRILYEVSDVEFTYEATAITKTLFESHFETKDFKSRKLESFFPNSYNYIKKRESND